MAGHHAPHRRWAWAAFSLLVTASLACGALGGGATPAPTAAPATSAGVTASEAATTAATDAPPTPTELGQASAATPSETPTATPLPVNTQPGELVVEEDLVFGSGPFDYPDTTAGLTELTSYQAELTVTFAGTRAGQAEAWTKTYVMLATNAPLARQWTIETTGDGAGVVFVAERDGAKFQRNGEEACTATAIAEGIPLTDRLELASLLTAVIGAEEAGAETINGVAASHYTFDQRALGEDGLTEAAGELWVAAEGGYLVKYVLSRTGGADYFGEGSAGTLTVDYALTEINQPVTLALPDDCPPGMVNAPLLPDAANVVNVPGLLAYDTATDLAAAVSFYQEQLPGLGWTPDGEPALAETATALLYTQGDQRLTVRLSAAGGQTTVDLTLTRLTE